MIKGLLEAGIDLGEHADVLFGVGGLVRRGTDAGGPASKPLPRLVRARRHRGCRDDGARCSSSIRRHSRPASVGRTLAKAFGVIAKSATTIATDVRTGVVEARLGIGEWPDGDVLHSRALDADTGELVVLDRHPG